MDLRGRTLGRSLALVSALGLLGAGATSALAQETIPDEKPEPDLPSVVIEGIDQSLLGVGEDADERRQPGTRGLPLTIPDAGEPVDVRLRDRAERVTFDDIDRPELPSPLTVRGFAYGGAYQTARAGFDLKHELPSGGLFGSLDGVASDGHLKNGAWTRIGVAAGAAFEPAAGGAFRVEVSRRSREQDLPVSGVLVPDLREPGETQSYQRWAADLRYRVDGPSGLVAGIFAEGSRSGFRPDQRANKQVFTRGRGGVNLTLPLSGRVWSVSVDASGGAYREEAPTGERETRALLDGRVTTRLADPAGWGMIAGVAYHQLGSADVVGPVLRFLYAEPPVMRYWVGVRPFFELPDLEGHLERTSVAAARVGQGPELASISGEGGLEIRPVSAMEVRAEANVRRSRGLLHLQRDEAGTYALANLDPRLIVDVGASAALTVVPGLVARAGYDLKIVEGTDPSYVAPYRGDAGITLRTWPVEVSGGVRYLGERHGGPTEGDLAGTWLAEAGVEVELASRWRVRAWGENLTDEEYREYGEYEARGRYVEAGVRYAF